MKRLCKPQEKLEHPLKWGSEDVSLFPRLCLVRLFLLFLISSPASRFASIGISSSWPPSCWTYPPSWSTISLPRSTLLESAIAQSSPSNSSLPKAPSIICMVMRPLWCLALPLHHRRNYYFSFHFSSSMEGRINFVTYSRTIVFICKRSIAKYDQHMIRSSSKDSKEIRRCAASAPLFSSGCRRTQD